jgi:hypothetical protein
VRFRVFISLFPVLAISTFLSLSPLLRETRSHNLPFFFGSHLEFCRQVKKRHVVPISAYRLGPPPEDSAYFTPPVGQIGVHRPREIVRVERDYTGGEVVQFSSAYPTDLEGRVSIFTFLVFFLAKG